MKNPAWWLLLMIFAITGACAVALALDVSNAETFRSGFVGGFAALLVIARPSSGPDR